MEERPECTEFVVAAGARNLAWCANRAPRRCVAEGASTPTTTRDLPHHPVATPVNLPEELFLEIASIEAPRGSFATATTTISRFAAGSFGGGTIYYPTSTTSGTFGAVAISPGYTAAQSSISWLGPRLASRGFVVITIDTLSRYDQPAERGDQLNAALTYLTRSSAVRDGIDPSRLAVMGHSMGGGGTLEAAKDNPALRATIGMTPYNLDKSWPEITTPSLIIGAQNDDAAPVSRHSIPFYNGLTSLPQKAYLELRGA
ncbi:dienelactone hydrolase family protein [Arthrobacter sp. B1805]|uniref:alpha/beta hydrolase family protein n=1 Tax=Arthrobacter sp. B1805 TaxID=2058892 RepID=UPI00215847F3|nr:dienelactone hydrolase family protein [Arthrobacter sp. B1805]